MFFKEYKKEYVIYIVLISSIVILFISLESFKEIINFINEVSTLENYNINFIKILLKLTGVSILLEYVISVCKDCGENALASKIDLGGKIVLISMSIPVLSNTVDILTSLIN